MSRRSDRFRGYAKDARARQASRRRGNVPPPEPIISSLNRRVKMLTIDYVRQGSVCFSTTHPDEPTLANIEMLQIAKQRIIDEDFDGPRTWGNVKIEPEYAHDRTNFQLVDESDIDALLAALPRCSYGDEEFAVIDGMCHEHARARDNRDDEQIQADREEDL